MSSRLPPPVVNRWSSSFQPNWYLKQWPKKMCRCTSGLLSFSGSSFRPTM